MCYVYRAFIGSLYRENNIRVFKIGKKDDGSIGNIQGAFDFPEVFYDSSYDFYAIEVFRGANVIVVIN